MISNDCAMLAFMIYWLGAVIIAWLAEKEGINGLIGCAWPLLLPLLLIFVPLCIIRDAIHTRREKKNERGMHN